MGQNFTGNNGKKVGQDLIFILSFKNQVYNCNSAWTLEVRCCLGACNGSAKLHGEGRDASYLPRPFDRGSLLYEDTVKFFQRSLLIICYSNHSSDVPLHWFTLYCRTSHTWIQTAQEMNRWAETNTK